MRTNLAEHLQASPLTGPSSEELNILLSLPPYELAERLAVSSYEVSDLLGLMRQVFSQPNQRLSTAGSLRLVLHVLQTLLYNAQSGSGIFKVADEHYNLGNDLFQAMLDPSMSYTCGYWDKSHSLEQAQIAKLDLLCRKLHLRPGMRVLDIGCGWGNFATYAAKNYGVQVLGLTISKEQADYAKRLCSNLPVEIAMRDYREEQGKFDRIVSIEMIEAVGRRNLPIFFDCVKRCLKDDGLFALQAISVESVSSRSMRYTDDFYMWLVKYIFPNGYVPSLSELMSPCSQSFAIEDLHNFGPDYSKTLQCWEKNFSAAWPKLSKRYPEKFRRRWRTYLLGCAALFELRITQLYQIIYSKNRLSSYSAIR